MRHPSWSTLSSIISIAIPQREYSHVTTVAATTISGRFGGSLPPCAHQTRNGGHDGSTVIRSSSLSSSLPLMIGCHYQSEWRRLYHIIPPHHLQQKLVYFSSTPSLKTKDETTTPTTATTTVEAVTPTTATKTVPLPSRTLGKTAVPTPLSSAPPPDTNPLQSLKNATPKSVIRQTVDLIVAGSRVVVTHIIKLPGHLWFYGTHPAETKAAVGKLRDTIRHEIHHYWVGTKLLWADIVTARKLLNKTLEGSALTRRERKQLLRTVSDLFRLIPFSMFIIVPFMEFALPFALRLFPNMLPSTYQDSLKAEENMKRELKSRIAMAQFFQE